MSEFELHKFSGMQYRSSQIISFSQSPLTHLADVDEEMRYHTGEDYVQVSGLTQAEFDLFVSEYADRYKSIYFFSNPKVKDLSALAGLKNTEYLLFYHVRAGTLWDMSGNVSLKGIMISESKRMVYDLTNLQYAPSLEELLLFSSLHGKYPVQSLQPIRNCRAMKRLWLDCNTEQHDFEPKDFAHLDVFKYQVDRKRNFSY